MHSFKISAALVATALFSLTGAQSIDPDSVPLATRQSWCQSQQSSCPLLCLQLSGSSSTTDANTCDAKTLDFECICGNGLSPNASEYSQTLPYFICTQYNQQCIKNCNGDSTCQAACVDDHPCGAQNPTRVNTTSSATQSATSSAGASSTNNVAYTGLGGSSAASTSTPKSGAQMTIDFGRSYGLAVVFASVFAGFALVM